MLNVFAVKGAKKIGINESIIYKFLIKGYFLCLPFTCTALGVISVLEAA